MASGLTFIFLDTLTTFMPMVENVSIHLKLTLNDIFMQIGIGTITITIALLVAQIPVLKTNPKEILSKMEG